MTKIEVITVLMTVFKVDGWSFHFDYNDELDSVVVTIEFGGMSMELNFVGNTLVEIFPMDVYEHDDASLFFSIADYLGFDSVKVYDDDGMSALSFSVEDAQ
ncbi:hypothetical protein KC887_08605 [Candidatus Kaiserbacteria bacterium]|nr:hypothetical protein [Candidatus Kaiserbacteria bacterium]